MRCPFCGLEDTQVKDSRPSEDRISIKRRRYCTGCNERFTTFERVQLRELMVIKKNGGRELFDRDKIVRSITIALRKRPVPREKIELTVNNIVRELEFLGESEVSSTCVGEVVMKALAQIDQVAYLRFASVYKEFREVEDFNKFLEQLNSIKNVIPIESKKL
ncbi:MAG: transcriptional regulator NrdR [Rickettsiales endosymbiont of Dermacentor nuttalli]